MKKVLKWIGIVLGGSGRDCFTCSAGTLLPWEVSMASRKYPTEVESVNFANSPEAIARGKHLAESVSLCVDCHGDNLSGITPE